MKRIGQAAVAYRWELIVFLSRWRHRIHYVVAAPFSYRNWWEIFLAKQRSEPTVLELRNHTKYIVRPHTTDLAVINEAVFLNPYLGSGYLHLGSNATVVDIGAYIGDFTIQAALLSPQGQIYAVEPILENCDCIRQQMKLNDISNVTILHLALGDHEGEIEIHDEGARSSSSWGDGKLERVRLATLEGIMNEYGIETIDLLKMDCEGAEWDILPASMTVLPRIRQLCLEFHNGKLTAEWLEPWLKENGFAVRRTPGTWNGLMWAWRSSD